MWTIEGCRHLGRVMLGLGGDVLMVWGAALAAETLFLRKQLALYGERPVKPRRASDRMRLALVLLTHRFAWREALTSVQPATLVRCHATLTDPRTFRGVVFSKSNGLQGSNRPNSSYMDSELVPDPAPTR